MDNAIEISKADQDEPRSTAKIASGLHYRPLLALGQGGMANVILAVGRGPSGFNKLVVLKAMRKELVADASLREMFLAEARLSAHLNNANVVQVHQVIDTAIPCIVMEYLDGQSLASLNDQGGDLFTLPMRLKVLSETLAGLHYSHELCDFHGTPFNIVHRDVSPQNIFVTYDGVVKVLDFGIAKAANATGKTQTGVLKGKIAYMPREQIFNEQIDRRVDVYAVGCMLWQIAGGVALWADKADGEIMRAVIEGTTPRPSELRPVDARLEAIVMKALSPEAADRYATALELQSAIEEFLSEAFPGTTMRAVGELVSNVFEAHRQARQAEIRTAIDASHSAPPPMKLVDGFENIVEFTPPGSSPGGVVPKRTGMRLAIGALAFSVLVAVGGWFIVATSRSAPAPQPTVTKTAAADQIEIRIAVKPVGATLTLDGRTVGENPARLVVAPDARQHEIRATMQGYEPYIRTTRFERDLSLEVGLEPILAGAPVASARAPAGSPAKTTKPKAARNGNPVVKSSADCNPPYYFDNGIKKYKASCL